MLTLLLTRPSKHHRFSQTGQKSPLAHSVQLPVAADLTLSARHQ